MWSHTYFKYTFIPSNGEYITTHIKYLLDPHQEVTTHCQILVTMLKIRAKHSKWLVSKYTNFIFFPWDKEIPSHKENLTIPLTPQHDDDQLTIHFLVAQICTLWLPNTQGSLIGWLMCNGYTNFIILLGQCVYIFHLLCYVCGS